MHLPSQSWPGRVACPRRARKAACRTACSRSSVQSDHWSHELNSLSQMMAQPIRMSCQHQAEAEAEVRHCRPSSRPRGTGQGRARCCRCRCRCRCRRLRLLLPRPPTGMKALSAAPSAAARSRHVVPRRPRAPPAADDHSEVVYFEHGRRR